ncbi:MAG: cyclic nucleotide-binding domain-containing protein [Planctomycetota bacterium]
MKHASLSLSQPATSLDDVRDHPLLLNVPERSAITAAGQLRELEPGVPIYRPGDEAQAFYLVLNGEVEAFTATGGETMPNWVFGPGEGFGEYALLRGNSRRTTGARARTKSLVFEIPAPVFAAHLASSLCDGREDQNSILGLSVRQTGLDVLRGLVLDSADDHCSVESFATGETVLSQRRTAEAAYFVIRGDAHAMQGDKKLAELTAGQCFGELAVIDDVPRSASVVAKTELVVLRVPAATFTAWVIRHRPLRDLVAIQRQVYLGPTGANATMIARSTTDAGEPCVTSTVCYADGRRYSATKVAERDAMIWTELSEPAETASIVECEKDGLVRRLHLAADARIVKIEASGDLEGIASLCNRLISKSPLKPALEARFRWSGTIAKPTSGELLCACVGLTVEDAKTLDPSLLRCTTGAGSVCGSCDRRVRALQGEPSAQPATQPCAEPCAERSVATTPDAPATPDCTGMPYPAFVEQVLSGDLQLPKAAAVERRLRADAPGLFEPSNARTAGVVAVLVGRVLVTGLAIGWGATHGWYLLMALAWVVQALNLYACLVVAHDCMHNAAFTSPRWNRVVGTLLTSTYIHRFAGFRDSHREHHQFNQSFDDPKTAMSSTVESVPRLYRKYISQTPAVIQNVLIAACAIPALSYLFLTQYEWSPMRRIRSWSDAADVLTIGTLLATCVLTLGWQLAAIVLLPPILLAYALLAVIFLTHSHEASLFAEEADPTDFELLSLNANNLTLGPLLDAFMLPVHRYHVEHHLFPTVPFYRLRELSQRIRADYGHLMLPIRRPTFRYVRRGLIDRLIHPSTVEIAGRRFLVGSRFASARVGFPEGA